MLNVYYNSPISSFSRILVPEKYRKCVKASIAQHSEDNKLIMLPELVQRRFKINSLVLFVNLQRGIYFLYEKRIKIRDQVVGISIFENFLKIKPLIRMRKF